MNNTEFLQRMGEVLAIENKQPEGWWYLSFASEENFLGVAIVRGRGPMTAALTAKSFDANPGEEMLAFPIGGMPLPEPKYLNRLLNLEELKAAFPEGVSCLTDAEEMTLEPID